MSKDSSSTRSSHTSSLFSSATFLAQNVSRRSFIKVLIGLALIEGEFVSCSSNNTFVPSAAAGIELLTYHGHTDWVFDAKWSPQSEYIASGGADATVQIWNAVNGENQKTYQHHDFVTVIAWSPDGNYVASGGDNGIVYAWNTAIATEEPAWKLNNGGHIWGLEWSPDGQYIAVGNQFHSIKIYDTSNNTLILTCDSQTGNVWNIAWSPDGDYIAAACDDPATKEYTVKVFDIRNNGHNNVTFDLHKDIVWGVDWSRDGQYIASGGFDNQVFVWKAQDRSVVYKGEHNDAVYGVAWSPDGTYVASSGQDGLVKVWDVSNRSNIVSNNSHFGPVFRSSWAPEGRRIVTAYRDGLVQIWRMPNF